jgi:hypothetical protein
VRRQCVYIRFDKALPDSNSCTTQLKANCFADSLGIPSCQKKQVLGGDVCVCTRKLSVI